VIASAWPDGRRPDITRIAGVRPQHRVTVIGTVRSTVAETIGTSPGFRCRIADGSGEISLIFLGQQQVAGLTPGRRCTAQGMPCVYRGRLVIWNPRYELEPADTPDEGSAPVLADEQSEAERVMVIYDDLGLSRVIEINLSSRGYQVAAAPTAAAAASPELRKADLIIVDMGLTGSAGISTVGMVREVTADPVIVVSALDDEAVKRAIFTAGADEFLVKPFSIGVLLDRVAEHLVGGREELTLRDHAG
jgi:CheY-like chemotaxis protein